MQSLVSDTPRWSSVAPSEPIFIPDDRLKVALLDIALNEISKTPPKPLSRRQLARDDYLPEVVLSEEKKSRFQWFGNLFHRAVAVIDLVRPAVIPGVILILCLSAIKAGSDWIDKNSFAGVFKTGVHLLTAGDVVDEHLPDGRVVSALYKGQVPDFSQLPSARSEADSHLGDMWFTQKDGTYWVLTAITPGSWRIGWVGP